MARLKERFDFENGALAAVRDAAKNVTGAYQDAARGLDTLKEWVLIEFRMPNTANAIHKLAHLQPQRFDVVGDLLHQRHILQIFQHITHTIQIHFHGISSLYHNVEALYGY